MLRNPYYIGYVTYKGVQYPGKHAPLVSLDLFEKVQLLLTANDATHGTKRRKHLHYLKGMLYCGSCGARLAFENVTGNGGRYAYFFCLGRQAKRTTCVQRAMPIDKVEAAVVRHYASVRLGPEQRMAVERFMREYLDDKRQFVAPYRLLLGPAVDQATQRKAEPVELQAATYLRARAPVEVTQEATTLFCWGWFS